MKNLLEIIKTSFRNLMIKATAQSYQMSPKLIPYPLIKKLIKLIYQETKDPAVHFLRL